MKYMCITLVICLSACVMATTDEEVLVVIKTRISFLVNLQGKEASCEDGWEIGPSGESCYKFNSALLSWNQSNDYCASQDAKLLKVETLKEHNFIKGRLADLGDSQSSNYYWIGGSYDTDTKTFKWGDGTPVESFGWGEDRPNRWNGNTGHQGCLDYLNHIGWNWNNHIDCENTPGTSICEKGPVPKLSLKRSSKLVADKDIRSVLDEPETTIKCIEVNTRHIKA